MNIIFSLSALLSLTIFVFSNYSIEHETDISISRHWSNMSNFLRFNHTNPAATNIASYKSVHTAGVSL